MPRRRRADPLLYVGTSAVAIGGHLYPCAIADDIIWAVPPHERDGMNLPRYSCLTLIASAFVGAVDAQLPHSPLPIVIDGRPSCATCRITVTERFTLTVPDDAPQPGWLTKVVLDSRGRFLVPSADGTRILIFDRLGKFERQFGRPGTGPGEFNRATAVVVTPGDSILIVDQPRSVHVYTPDLVWVRDMPGISSYGGVIPLGDGGLVEFSHGFQVISPSGMKQRSFGVTDRPTTSNPTCRSCGDQYFAGASGTTLWATVGNRYLLEEWTISGTLGRVFEIESPWFQPWDAQSDYLSGAAPRTPFINSVSVESPSLIWIAGVHAASDWKPRALPTDGSIHASKTKMGTVLRIPSPGAIDGWLLELSKGDETVFDVVDLVAHHVVASSRFPGLVTLINLTTASQLVEDSDGNMAIKIFTVKRTR